jgi:hypothetical protein
LKTEIVKVVLMSDTEYEYEYDTVGAQNVPEVQDSRTKESKGKEQSALLVDHSTSISNY